MVHILKKIKDSIDNLFKNKLSFKNIKNIELKENKKEEEIKYSSSNKKEETLSYLTLEYRSNILEFLVQSIGRNGGYLNLKTPDKSEVFSRNYTSGDPVSRIDWKAFVRSDSLIIREKPKEAHTRVLIVIDVSRSMDWKYENDISKKELAFRVGMFLGYLHLKKEDLVRFLIFNEKEEERFLNIKNFSDIIDIFNYYIEGRIDEFSLDRNDKDDISGKSSKNNEDNYYLSSELKHFSYYDLSYIFSDTLSLEYEKYLKSYSILFHTLSSKEINIDNWMSKNEIYYCKEKNKRYSGSYLLRNGFYHKNLEKWLESRKKSISRQSNYMLLNECMNIEEFCLKLNNILKESR